MVFSSVSFLIYFLPIVIGLYYMAPTGLKNMVLLVTSLFFYAWGEPVYVLLMIFSIILNYGFGVLLDRLKGAENGSLKLKVAIGLNVVINIGILGFFKYEGFLVENINLIFGTSISSRDLPLPIGISFYTFQAMSYIIDLYRGKVKVQRNIVAFGTYVTLFPQLIAGPIVRFQDIEKQLIKRHVNALGFATGVRRFATGLAKKVLLANNIGILWETVSSTNLEDMSMVMAWLGAVAFTLQIYFDFSGYSDMAIGLGKMFGFDFPENFNYPYIAGSITEFWRRWHISLSSWFKEYVYIPLGGNRKGMVRQTINIFVVWSLTGLWHGANWNFVIWGIYFAVLLVMEKLIVNKALERMRDMNSIIGGIISHGYTMIFVIFSWMIFASDNLREMMTYLFGMLGLNEIVVMNDTTLYLLENNAILLMLCIIGATQIPVNTVKMIRQQLVARNNIIVAIAENIWTIILLVTSFAFIVASTYNPFLYFRF